MRISVNLIQKLPGRGQSLVREEIVGCWLFHAVCPDFSLVFGSPLVHQTSILIIL
ncbi:Hypothetical predicted protein [Marmota monax]|uniref:Uncharacterized protein n=1 Tax=Marmota monax TaxID=9995 RepID=A0A5E4C6G9_MARMO|nr:hypothetical protein GHT09_020008 [Marmota monax]VTJ77438.1 Hypothetical predicted protein [Marmota monax]